MKTLNFQCFRSLLLLLTMSLIWNSAQAERIPVEKARKVAITAVKQFVPSTRSSLSLNLVYQAKPEAAQTKSTEEADFYVFNLSNDNGYVIVSGEDRVRPVLGYSYESGFDINDIPDNFRNWLEGYQEEIAFAIQQDIEQTPTIQAEWASYLNGSIKTKSEEVLIETAEWDQGDPYNRKCPVKKGEKTLTGCVATAMAIVMRHYQWPDQANRGVSSYEGQRVTYSPYDWDNLPMKFNSPVTEEQAENISSLLWNIGANVNMNYGTMSEGGSSALSTDAAEAFRKVFKYSKQTRYMNKDYYADNHWKAMLKEELDANHPVYYDGGKKDNSGHAFVCDGYRNNTFHFNWGWSGAYNGFFSLTSLDPEGSGQPFSARQGCIFVNKAQIGDDYVREISLNKDLKSNKAKVGSFPVSINFHNSGSADIRCKVAIAVVDVTNYSVKEIVSEKFEPELLPVNYGYYQTPVQIRVTLKQALGENERLMAVYQSSTSPWTAIRSSAFKDRIGENGPEKDKEGKPYPGMEYYKVTTEFKHITGDVPGKVKKEKQLTALLIPEEGYELPGSIQITMGYINLFPLQYSYNKNTGELSVPNVKGDLTIKAVGVQQSVANETITESDSYYSVVDGKLIIQSAESIKVCIYTFAGNCVYNRQINGCQEVNLPHGAYILQIGDKQNKIVL